MYLTDNKDNLIPIKSKDLKGLIGKEVVYLPKADIDRSGRGFYWPRIGVVETVKGRNICFGSENWLVFNQIEEIVLLENYKPQS